MLSHELLISIAQKFGTPVIVYNEDLIRQTMRDFIQTFKSDFFATKILYASKAFLCQHMAQLALDENFCFDAVSGAEVDLLARVGVKAEQIYFHGNNKTPRELQEFLQLGRGQIVIDNIDELNLLISTAQKLQKTADILIRVNPGIDAHTHAYITTACKDSKFGISIAEADAIAAIIEKINQSKLLSFKGFHAHIGSQIFQQAAFTAEIETMVDFIATMRNQYQIKTEQLDLGGGFAIHYTDSDAPIPIRQLCRDLIKKLESALKAKKLTLSHVIIEPGRSIVGAAACTLYTVGSLKKTETIEYAFIDGGMSDNIRPALYQAEYSCTNISQAKAPLDHSYDIAGKCCESGDILIHQAKLPKTQRGDILKVNSTGAYGYSMASNYNRLGRPPVIFVKDGVPKCVLRREDYDDMLALECRNN